MARMRSLFNSKPDPVALQQRQQQRAITEEFSRIYAKYCPWLASALPKRPAEPDQRGFIIGSVRL